MLSFDESKGRFSVRVAGVLVHKNKILVHRADRDTHWALPGGRCEWGESSAETIIREYAEEIDARVKVDRLLWVIENFFELNGIKVHEIGFYYLLNFESTPSPAIAGDTFTGNEEHRKLFFEWRSLADLKILKLYPKILLEKLQELPLTPELIVNRYS